MFLAQRESTKGTGMAGTDYLTAKDDLELNLIDLIKAQSGGGETKEPDLADAAASLEEEEAAVAAGQAEAEAEQRIAEEAAAMEVMKVAEENEVAEESEAADDFKEDW